MTVMLHVSQAMTFEPGTHLVSSGALATLSGAKTGRSPKDKRIVREAGSESNIWWNQAGNGSPNFEMDERQVLFCIHGSAQPCQCSCRAYRAFSLAARCCQLSQAQYAGDANSMNAAEQYCMVPSWATWAASGRTNFVSSS